ncbi:MAG: C_GCAxxG_C_C family protein, partial [Elusimicrobiaceae bacterium]|nr:C_GCAxxG_C_C family protein [Elusimicrobiaceae bacterium]
QLFLSGYNCAQSVFVAFADVMGLNESFAAKLASSFGGGMGRMREVCGVVSGMLMVLGVLYGYDTKNNDKIKEAHYSAVQKLSDAFRKETGTIICRELLGLPGAQSPTPEPRTPQYYQKRPCAEMVGSAAEIFEKLLQTKNS